MVSRSGDSLVVRSVVSGAALYQDDEPAGDTDAPHDSPSPPVAAPTSPSPSVAALLFDNEGEEQGLPQCKIKRSYMCPRCTFYTQNPRVYLYHLKTVHHEKIKVFECPHCLYASKHSQKLQRHVTMVHAPGKDAAKPPPAPKPPKSKAKPKFPRRPLPMLLPARLDGHGDDDSEGRLVIDDAKDDKAPSDRAEQVVVCTEEEVAMDAAAQQNGSGVFLCSVCSFTSRSESLMTRHERIVHLKKKIFRCSRCSYVTNLKSRFTKHVKYHTMPLIKCGQCDFKTAYKWNLDRHHRNHGGPGSFHCTICNFAADIKQSLTVHEMNHHVAVVGDPAAAGTAGVQGAGPRRRLNKVGGSDCGLATEEDAIDADELELLRLEREETAPPQVSPFNSLPLTQLLP